MQLTKKDILMAQTGLQNLDSETRKSSSRKSVRLVSGAENSWEVNLPPQAVEALMEVLEHLSEGREVTVLAQPVEFSTQKAAQYLNVSRPFLVGLLEKGAIPFRKVGTHRRVLFEDLNNYFEQL